MLAISFLGAAFVVGVSAAALGLIAWLLSGSPTVVTRSVRGSATHGTDAAASGCGRPGPTPVARPARSDQ
jgi:hypothetical protein